MIIDSKVWYALSDEARSEYLRMFKKIEVKHGSSLQEVVYDAFGGPRNGSGKAGRNRGRRRAA
jgi:hypothetical protein